MRAEGRLHHHVYVAGDDTRQGDYAPIALVAVTRKGYLSRSAANRAAEAREPDPSLRLVRSCTRHDCKIISNGRPGRRREG